MPPLVTIVGRPNVGKSTLFNRLVKNRRAIVDGTPGVTRDRLYDEVELRGRRIRVADTGGLDLDDADNILSGIRDQAIAALNEADLVIFVVDVRAGLTPADKEIAAYLRRYGKPIILTLNKVDSNKQIADTGEFSELGLENPVPISAEHGLGTEQLVNSIIELLPDEDIESEQGPGGMKVAIIGRPNVGKSSLLNAILGDRRMIVSEMAGTTRDVVDVEAEVDGRKFIFLDTAGIRKKTAIKARLEAVTSIKARETISRADCCILVIDTEQGITSQDKALAGMIDRESSGAVVALNKWDLVKQRLTSGEEGDSFIKELSRQLKALNYAPAVTTSALSGQRVPKLIDTLVQLSQVRQTIIAPAQLGDFLAYIQSRNPVPLYKGKQAEIFRMTHVTPAPARFRLFVRGYLQENYLRYIENELRSHFGLQGVPIRLAIVRV